MSEHSTPIVKLLNVTGPYEDIVSSARTCYSPKGIVLPEDVSQENQKDLQDGRDHSRFVPLVQSLYQAGHHTTFQHSYLHFSMENTSRNVIWSFLHSHPFYNSEQVSQRYVRVKKDQFFVPEGLNEITRPILDECYEYQIKAYKSFNKLIAPLVEAEYLKRFKSRKGSKQAEKDVKKKSQEVSRAILPLGTTAYLHHTVSYITLLRYYRLCDIFDVPAEQKSLVEQMIRQVAGKDANLKEILQEPLSIEETPEYQFMKSHYSTDCANPAFVQEFDAELDGKVSLLVDYKVNQEKTLANAIREVYGISRQAGENKELIQWALDSSKNPLLGENLNLGTHSKMMRCLLHAHYTFQKKLSHAGDSQDQRHRMTPGSRPILKAHYTGQPDYIEPLIVRMDGQYQSVFAEHMNKIYDYVEKGLKAGMNFEQASYMLPNALSIRFTESADLLNLKHKMAMRLCYNAQEEIWQASLEEALQISKVHPEIGKYLLPPCNIRKDAKTKPVCPEGPRFCGVPVWKLPREEYSRSI